MRFDEERVAGLTTRSAMVDALVHDLNRRVVDASPHLLLHAGGVASGGVGGGVPGQTEAGKTTLTAGLVRAGLGYLTDEALALDRETLLVQPYPKPLSIDPGAWAFFPELEPPVPDEDGYDCVQWQVPATAIRPESLAGPCPVVAVVFPRYEAGADTALVPVGRGEALVELAKNTFHFKERGARELDLLAELARGVDCYRLTMGELDQAVDLVAGLVGVTPDHRARAMSESGPVDEDFVPARSAAVHTVEIDGEAVLLDQAAERLHHLNATAALVWACLDGRSTVGQIAADLGDELGVPVDTVLADTMVVMRRLRDEGLLADEDPLPAVDPTMAERWRRGPAVLWRRSLDAALVLPPSVDDPLTLAGTGAGLWDLLARADLHGRPRRRAGRPVQGARRAPWRVDLRPVLAELEAIGAIERVTEEG